MIWADRLALVWGGLLVLVMACLWRGPGNIFNGPEVWGILEVAVGLPWLILRGLDFVFMGKIRFGASLTHH